MEAETSLPYSVLSISGFWSILVLQKVVVRASSPLWSESFQSLDFEHSAAGTVAALGAFDSRVHSLHCKFLKLFVKN